jgi:release factor glutamine methyltransferase
MNGREAARWVADELADAGIEEAPLEAEVLVRNAAAMDRAQFFSGKEIACERLPLVRINLERRLTRRPLAYITGEREFYGRTFAVTPSVLIPRPETELLVELVLAELTHPAESRTPVSGVSGTASTRRSVLPSPAHGREDARAGGEGIVADIGTGSGCIAISIACERPGMHIIATDISIEALAVARVNALRHAVDIDLRAGSLAQPIDHADIIVANLPYIPTMTIESLEPEVRDFEPRAALDGGLDGLYLIRELITDCGTRLRPGLLALEVGDGQAPAVAGLVAAAGGTPAIHRDLAGIERVVCGRWQ